MNREAFILEAIREYQGSDTYLTAATAQLYYSTDNEAIGKRLGYLERQMRSKVNVKFHRLRNGFFPKAIKRLVLYLMGNGSTLDDAIKAKIDRKFDNAMILGAINACVDGVVWGFPEQDELGRNTLKFFRATEFKPLEDERTGKAMAGIRFWQLAPNKPMYIELYEVDGITEYITNEHGSGIIETIPKRSYLIDGKTDEVAGKIRNNGSINYGVLPVFPLYANELKTSELTTGLQALIDAYDFISSDLVDGITLIEGIYWIVKNFGGQDTAQLLTELQELKATLVDGADTGADSHTIETPFAGKQAALELLETRMYDDFLLPNIQVTTSNATATQMKMVREDMDIKADLLEWQVAEFIEQVLLLKGHTELLANYKRRTTTNDTETVQNISTQIMGAWIDEEEAIKLDPTIPQDDKEDLIQRIELRATGIPPDEEEPPVEEESAEDDSEV